MSINYLSPETITFGLLLAALSGCAGWWLRRFFFRALEQRIQQENQLPSAQEIELDEKVLAATAQKKAYESQRAAKELEISKWQQRYRVARKEIEERINIMDEVESDNIELDSALCKSIVEQEKLQMLLHQRNESLDVLNSDRTAQESRLLSIKEELDAANQRIQELGGLSAAPDAGPHGASPAPQRSERERQLELLTRELTGKDRVLEQMRKELRAKDAQLDELQLELTCQSTLAKADAGYSRSAANNTPAGIVINDDAVLVQAPANLFSVAPQQADNLQQIQGIGTKLERVLNELGVYQFRQIAEFTATDLLWLDQQLGAFKGRIDRDNWVAQAEQLCRAEAASDY